MKKTGIDKVISRKPNTILLWINRLKQMPFKEQIVIRDFTGRKYY